MSGAQVSVRGIRAGRRAVKAGLFPSQQAPHDRGVGTALSALVVVVLGLCSVGGLIGYTWVQANREAQSASDLSALAAAQAATFGNQDKDSCEQAERIASANGATLVTCEIVRALDQVGVKVVVQVNIKWPIAGLPEFAESTSYAGNPDD